MEHFEYRGEIDNIVVVCIKEWMGELEELLKRYGITKVTKIIPGGATGHDSIYYGLCSMPMHIVGSTKNNIKITEPADFYIYRALYEALEGQQVFGI